MNVHHSKQLATERQKSGLSQSQLAKALGFASGQYISNVERGVCRLSADHFKKLSKIIGHEATKRLINATLKDDRAMYFEALK